MSVKVQPTSRSELSGFIVRTSLRFLQFVFALAVAGLYGTDLNNARKHGIAGDPKWVYAETIAGLSALTCIVFMVPFVKSYLFFAWDVLLFIFWVAVFGTFGKMYIHENAEGDAGVQRMKNAVWVDLFNMLLWFVTAVYGGMMFFRYRGARTTVSGKAMV
ncbi:MAG: hypothetical protein M1812_006180 [Candelaria pacifica]|nr:MAG: hypothetical protein M1812_006180 [Candelaria pacifica]